MHPDLVAEVEKQDNIWGLVLFVLSILGLLATAIADILDIYEFLLTEWLWHARAPNIQAPHAWPISSTHPEFVARDALCRSTAVQQSVCQCADVLMCITCPAIAVKCRSHTSVRFTCPCLV